jgi:hypothetical protein
MTTDIHIKLTKGSKVLKSIYSFCLMKNLAFLCTQFLELLNAFSFSIWVSYIIVLQFLTVNSLLQRISLLTLVADSTSALGELGRDLNFVCRILYVQTKCAKKITVRIQYSYGYCPWRIVQIIFGG